MFLLNKLNEITDKNLRHTQAPTDIGLYLLINQ